MVAKCELQLWWSPDRFVLQIGHIFSGLIICCENLKHITSLMNPMHNMPICDIGMNVVVPSHPSYLTLLFSFSDNVARVS
jgi:hypothetical protein